eukprot:2659787-Pyramimonas_sp.AAC.1
MYAHQVAAPTSYGYDALYGQQAQGPAAPPPDRAVPASFFDGASGATSEEDLLQRALQEEMLRTNRNGRGADPFKKMVVPQMVEVKQSALTTSSRPMETMAEVGDILDQGSSLQTSQSLTSANVTPRSPTLANMPTCAIRHSVLAKACSRPAGGCGYGVRPTVRSQVKEGSRSKAGPAAKEEAPNRVSIL